MLTKRRLAAVLMYGVAVVSATGALVQAQAEKGPSIKVGDNGKGTQSSTDTVKVTWSNFEELGTVTGYSWTLEERVAPNQFTRLASQSLGKDKHEAEAKNLKLRVGRVYVVTVMAAYDNGSASRVQSDLSLVAPDPIGQPALVIGQGAGEQTSTVGIPVTLLNFPPGGTFAAKVETKDAKGVVTAIKEFSPFAPAQEGAGWKGLISHLKLALGTVYTVTVRASYADGQVVEVRGSVRVVDTPASQLLRFTGFEGQKGTVGDSIKKAVEDPETLNKVLKSALNQDNGWNFIKDLHLDFKLIHLEEGDTLPALTYDFAKTIKRVDLSATQTQGLDLDLRANGTLTTDWQKNPEDFLTSSVSFTYFISVGGAKEVTSDDTVRHIQELGEQLAHIKTTAELLDSPLWNEYMNIVQNQLTTQYYFQGEFQASLESNQTFTARQGAFELVAGVEIKPWNDTSPLAQFNLFDWPFALARTLSGYDREWRPRGFSFPNLLVAIGKITPVGEDNPRIAIGDTSDFWRWRAESSFRTPVATVAGSTVFFNANVRCYQEINPSQSVKSAGLDTFWYATFDLASSSGPYVSYSTGKLPFEVERERVYAAGVKVSF